VELSAPMLGSGLVSVVGLARYDCHSRDRCVESRDSFKTSFKTELETMMTTRRDCMMIEVSSGNEAFWEGACPKGQERPSSGV
jgi:hypothetical protein